MAHLSTNFCLVAVGSYGRKELVPQSDIDILLLHEAKVSADEVAQVADSIWYPLWDSGISVDHSVRSPTEVIDNLRSDHRVLLGLLDARFLTGSSDLFDKTWSLIDREVRSRVALYNADILWSVAERHESFGTVAFDLEPNLKESAGGTRDVSILRSIVKLGIGGFEADMAFLTEVAKRQSFLREWLYRVNPKAQDRLSLLDQVELASKLGIPDVSNLIYPYARDAQRVSVLLQEALAPLSKKNLNSRAGKSAKASGNLDRPLERTWPAADLSTPSVHEIVVAIEDQLKHGLDRSLSRLEHIKEAYRLDGSKKWSEKDRNAFLSLLQRGDQLLEIWNLLDVSGLWCSILPEWEEMRFLRRPNAFHRYSVDRHLIETAKVASSLRDRVHRTDLLLFAALLHDLGKARVGDHSKIGRDLVKTVAERLGFSEEDGEILAVLVEHHLLLAEVITRRDLSDPTTVETVAEKMGSSEVLELLTVLTEADSIATGVVPWSKWKTSLLAELEFKVRRFLDEGVHLSREPKLPSYILEELVTKASSGYAIVAVEDHLYVGACDKTGLFATVVGSLAVSGISVVSADVFERDGVAIDAFRVGSWSGGEPNYQRFKATLKKALNDEAFLLEKIKRTKQSSSYRHDWKDTRDKGVLKSRVSMLDDVSDSASVVEIWTSDRRGVLFELAREISMRGFDIRHAKILTMGVDVVDTFYIVDGDGQKINDNTKLKELITGLNQVLGAADFVART